jgi:dipeptidyl aminopeptidase/acylaminoacyl peptidase
MTTPEAATAEQPKAPPSAKGEPAPKRPMREDDVLAFVWIADPQISPDGTKVAFTRVHVDREADEYRTTLWIGDTSRGDARPLTSGDRDSQPRWSPDGTRIAFVRAKEAVKPGQLHVLPMTGGEASCLTALEKGVSLPAWSPDGLRIAFLSGTNPALDDPEKKKPKNEPARVVTKPVFRENNVGFYDFEHRDHVWVVEAAGGTPRQITTGRFAEGAPQWSRDGKRIFTVSDRRDEPWFGLEDSKLYAVSPELATPTDGAELGLVADFAGPVLGFVEAKDGRFAVIGGILAGVPHAYEQWDVLLLSGPWPMKPKRLNATRDYAIGEGVNSDQHPPRGGGEVRIAFNADQSAVLVGGAREGASLLLSIDIASGAVKELTPRANDVVAATSTPDGKRWAMTLGSLERPGDLYAFDVTGTKPTKLYGPNDAWLSGIALGQIEEIWYTSFDGTKCHGWIVKPPDFDPKKKYPLILEIHGGPHTAYGVGFFHEFHQLAGAGYVVLYTNPRGSTSYGWEFAHVIQYKYPGDDATDLLVGVDEVVKRGYVDAKKLGVTGGSGGGLLTNWLVTQTDRFAAAVTQRCVSEWASMMYSADFAMFLPYWFKKQPYEDPQEYLERSPVSFADRITTPLMVIHSEEDWRTPIGQGEAMFRALKYQRKPTVMIRFPGENHELSRSGTPSRRVQNQEHIKKWFEKWLMGKDVPGYE